VKVPTTTEDGEPVPGGYRSCCPGWRAQSPGPATPPHAPAAPPRGPIAPPVGLQSLGPLQRRKPEAHRSWPLWPPLPPADGRDALAAPGCARWSGSRQTRAPGPCCEGDSPVLSPTGTRYHTSGPYK
jgi:hypothetical protein